MKLVTYNVIIDIRNDLCMFVCHVNIIFSKSCGTKTDSINLLFY